jgi:uncharacterized protein
MGMDATIARNPAEATSLLVLQSTPFCNIACKYCYLYDKSSRHVMSTGVVAATIERLVEAQLIGNTLAVCWHAGEPLTLPIEYYEQAIECIRTRVPKSCSLQFKVQTNGTLITNSWCDFFARHDFQVGMSIDGPRVLHDEARVTRSGKGTFDKTVRGLRLLASRGIDFHVICVLGKRSLSHARQLFEFFRDEQVKRVCFNIEETEGIHRSELVSARTFIALFQQFYREYVSIVERSNEKQWVREIDSPLEALFAGHNLATHNSQVSPFGIVTIDWEGGLSTFSPELIGTPTTEFGNFVFGNVMNCTIAEMRQSALFSKVYADILSGVNLCRATCEYFGVCGGGAPSNKYFENGSMASGETIYCRAIIKTTTDLILERIATGDNLSLDTASEDSHDAD